MRRIRFVNREPQAPEIMDDGLEFPDGIGILTVKDDLVTLTGQSNQAQVQGVQKSRGAVDAATLPSTGAGDVTGAAGALLLGLVLALTRRIRNALEAMTGRNGKSLPREQRAS